MQFPTLGALIGDAVRLTHQLLDAAESALLREHADHWLDAARQIWSSVCHLHEVMPAAEDERADVAQLCAEVSARLHSLEADMRRH